MTANADMTPTDGESRQRNDSRNDRHLPECPTLDFPPFVDEDWDKGPCICDRLRACEQRLTEDSPAVFFGYGDEKAVIQIRDMGYVAGVQSARDAVAALTSDRSDVAAGYRRALAAIDALRGES